MKRFLIILATAAVLIGGTVLATNAYARRIDQNGGQLSPQIYSPNRLMLELWSAFKKNMLEAGTGRTIQKDQDGDSTAMGQAMTMQRAVWMDDLTTFDASWQWTKDNLQTDDYNISGSFGELVNGKYGIKESGSTAAGDINVAYGLIMGSARWREGKYLWDSRPLMVAAWRDHVAVVDGKPVFATTKSASGAPLTLDTADFAPQILRTFAKVDPSHDWAAVLTNTYDLLTTVNAAQPDKMLAASYRFDAAAVTPTLRPAANDATIASQGRDLQVVFNLALDYRWNDEPRAKTLIKSYAPLSRDWSKHHSLLANYRTDGTAVNAADVPATYGMLMGYFADQDRPAADAIYRRQLLTLYNPDTQSWTNVLGYRNDTWAWLGIALYNDELADLGGLYE